MRKHNRRFITSPVGSQQQCEDLVTVILLSENSGYRMKSYGPTPLLRLGGTTLLDTQISAIKSVFRNFELILCCGFDSEKIVKHVRDKYNKDNIRIVENQVYQNSNGCESARLCLNNTVNDKILLCDGSLMINKELLSLINPECSHIISSTGASKNLEVGFTANARGNVENFSYGIENTWSESVFLNNEEVIESFRGIVSAVDYKNKFIFEALNQLANTKHQIKVVQHEDGALIKINNIKTYHAVRSHYEGTSTKLRD